MLELSEAAEYVLKFVSRTSSPVFLTGKAGTGKTTLLREIIRTTYKNAVVVAPTGIAALNAGGVTIHSMFGLPLAAFIPESGALPQSPYCNFENRDTLRRHFRISAQKRAVIRAMDLLVIDEVSMLRPDLLDALDLMLQHVRRVRAPFGGVQVLFIGDLLQLPPVIKNEEWNCLSAYYEGKYFFNSRALVSNPPVYIELSKIYRQDDQRFIDILNELRHNTLSPKSIAVLNSHVRPGYNPAHDDDRIILTTHNAKADAINERSLAALQTRMFQFEAEIIGDFPERMFPIDPLLQLKEGAQVMFIKNDLSPEKRFFNGKCGVVESVSDDEIVVLFPEEGLLIEVPRYEWQNVRYKVDESSREITEEILGTFVQYPLRLAWAITVHKSQGLTFDKAALDVTRVFMPGQAYVALSRLRSLDGLILLDPIRFQHIGNDQSVVEFSNRADNDKLQDRLQSETAKFIGNQILSGFDFSDLEEYWSELFAKPSAKAAKLKKAIGSQREVIEKLAATSRNFQAKIRSLSGADPALMLERTSAAANYFIPPLTELLSAVRHERDNLRKGTKGKGILAMLDNVDDAIHSLLLGILKSERIAEVFSMNETPSRENLGPLSIAKIYRDRVGEIRPRSPEKAPVKKKNTFLQTLELWQDGQSVHEIALLRKLSEKTIITHMAQLVQIKAVNVAELIPKHQLEKLHEIFDGSEAYTLSQMKNMAGENFSYEDLKIFRASLTNVPQEQPE